MNSLRVVGEVQGIFGFVQNESMNISRCWEVQIEKVYLYIFV
jgi:hypothetical protein